MRIAIAEDSALFRDGLTALLDAAGMSVVTAVATGDELIAVASAGGAADVAIVDMRMPPSFTDEGLRTAAALHRTDPNLGVMILSTYRFPDYAIRLMEIRDTGVGYLIKDRVDDLVVFVDALRRVQSGEVVIDSELVADMVRRRLGESRLDPLSEREREVLQLMAEGRSNNGIAGVLQVSHRTVEAHVARVFDKLELPDEADTNRRVLASLVWLRSTLDTHPRADHGRGGAGMVKPFPDHR